MRTCTALGDCQLGIFVGDSPDWAAAAAAALLWVPASAQAQGYPNRPITFIIGFAPGGPSDVMSRILGRRMEQELKQPLIIENKTGAAGGIAAQLVSRAAPT